MNIVITKFALVITSLIILISCDNSKNSSSKEINMEDKIELDSIKLNESIVALKVMKVEDGIGGKFIWDKAKIVEELNNKLNIELPLEIEIAHYSFKKGLPKEECIAYLTYFPLGAKEMNSESNKKWIILNGDGDYGVQKIMSSTNKK